MLVVIAAEQYASRLVVPKSQQTPSTRWSSHKDHAARALEKLAGPHLPASLAQLQKAVERAHRDYDAAGERVRSQAAKDRAAHADLSRSDAPGAEEPLGEELEDGHECDVAEYLDDEGADF